MGIAYILYLANGGKNNRIQKPSSSSIMTGHGSVGLDTNGHSSLRCDIAGTEYSDKRSYSAGEDLLMPKMRSSSHNTNNTSLEHIEDDEV